MSLTTLAVAQHAAAPAPALRPPVADPKITPRHLARQALIYVRQSSPTQVQRHPESARRQYALTERAHRLGWPAEQVTIIARIKARVAPGALRPTSGTALPSWSRRSGWGTWG